MFIILRSYIANDILSAASSASALRLEHYCQGENILREVQQEAGLSLFCQDANKITLGASVEPLCSCVHEEYRLMAYVANMVA